MRTQIIDIEPDVTEVILRLPRKPDPAPTGIQKGALGIDVSKWQGEVNWDGMKAAGVAFAGIRATMGTRGDVQADGSTRGLDQCFERNWAEAKRVGILRCAYHYFANNGVIPGRQVDNFISALGDDRGELTPVLDVEAAKGQVIVNPQLNARNVAEFLVTFEQRTGLRPVIYTNKSAWDACTGGAAWGGDYKLWHAQYTSAPQPKINPPWTSCVVWQYSATGSLAGTSPLDLNRWGVYP